MTREEAKSLFRNDKDSYGKPKSIMTKIDLIYDEFEKEKQELITPLKKLNELINSTCNCAKPWGVSGKCVICTRPIKIS